jgi:hypothetical protein
MSERALIGPAISHGGRVAPGSRIFAPPLKAGVARPGHGVTRVPGERNETPISGLPGIGTLSAQVGHTRLYNVASFEWSRVVQRGLLSGQLGRSSRGFRARASQFDAQSAAFPDGLMWHRRSDSRPTVDGGAHGPAHGSPSADCARVVRENEIQCPASDRRLRLSSASGAADTGCADARQGRAAASPADDNEAAEN